MLHPEAPPTSTPPGGPAGVVAADPAGLSSLITALREPREVPASLPFLTGSERVTHPLLVNIDHLTELQIFPCDETF